MKYYAIHTHLHCSHEPTASIGSHMSHCKELGIEYMWTTEHDTRMGTKKLAIPVFRFSEKELYTTLANGVKAGFKEEEGNSGAYAFSEEEKGIALLLSAERNERESMLFDSSGKKHCDPLFSRLTVTFEGSVEAQTEGQVCVEFVLSCQAPSYERARLCYVLGDIPAKKEGEVVQYLPFPEKKNGVYAFPLSQDAGEEIGGLDNALCNIRLTVENGATLLFRSFSFARELNFEQVRQEQIKLAKKLGEKWGVTAFVGFEITEAGQHKNCFSTTVPVMDRVAFDHAVSNEQAIEHVKKYGGIFSWNHPFNSYAKSGKSKEEFFEELAQRLIGSRVYGASLLEVGFPIGRDGYEAKDYLRLWDRLSEKGIMITGDGDSDNHHALEAGWIRGNNFCTFAGLYEAEKPTEENFVKAFRRGSVWGGNPVLIKNLSFGTGDKPQGSLIRGGQVCVEFNSTDIKCGGYAVCVTNGKEVKRMNIENGSVSGSWVLSCEQKYNFARVEIYNEEDLLIAFSNPIYLIDENTEIEER